MKKIAILLLILGYTSCKQSVKKEVKTESITTNEIVVDKNHNTNQIPKIELNNGEKWKINSETTTGIQAMIALLEEKEYATADAYKQLGYSLTKEKNTIIEKCNIQGPPHDNLHVFLHPLFENIDLLDNVKTKIQEESITASIKKQLLKYSDFFE